MLAVLIGLLVLYIALFLLQRFIRKSLRAGAAKDPAKKE